GHGVLKPYFEALRDRLVHYFEIRNMTHKPKLVAVAGCAHGVGASTIAKGLALSLSDAGDGNILLVDMNSREARTHALLKNKTGCELPKALETESMQEAQVNEKLYWATADDTNGSLPRILPKRFSHLVPKMKASDYDYIIFD